MTIQFPDVSHYNSGLRIEAGTPAVIAKVTEGVSLVDGEYSNFKAKAASVGAVFSAYHFLHHGNVQSQAMFCYSHAGKTPLMIDAEDPSANLTVGDLTGFIDTYRQQGGVTQLIYLPHWYWAGRMGGPSLDPIKSRGMHLVASEYRAYSDAAWPGAYGGMSPEVWQYTNARTYGGQSVDFNAFRGTQEQFAQLIGGTMTATDDKVIDWIDPRVAAIARLQDTIPSGPSKGEAVPLTQYIKEIHAAVTAPAVVTLTDAQINQLAAQVTANHPKLGDGDEPAIVDALKTFFGPAVQA